MSFSGDFEMTWNDPALVWDPSQYGGQTIVIAPETDVWRPDVTVYNSVSQTDIIPEAQRLVSISSNGNVMKSSPAVYSTRCQLQINHFPFDTQTCQIRLSSWVYDMTELTIDAPSWVFNYSKPTYTGNSEWDILDLKVLDVTTNDTDGSKFSELEYLVTLKRHSTYYICVVFIPTFIVTTLSLIGFFIPFDNCGNRMERITLGLTTLLSLAVMLNIVGSDMPKSSNLPQLGGFVLAECLICGVAMLVTIILLFGHQRINTRRILPGIKGANKIGTKKGWMGMRALKEVDSSRSIDEMKKTAEDVVYYLRTLEAREELRLYWLKIFDKIDLFFLVLFQIVNIIVMLCYLLIR